MADETQPTKNSMLDVIAKMDSQVIRAAGVALISLLAKIVILVAGLFGFEIHADTAVAQAIDLLDESLLFIAAAGTVWAIHARINKPNPPLSYKAIEKRQELVDQGKLTTIANASQSVAAPAAVKEAAATAAGFADMAAEKASTASPPPTKGVG